MLPVIAIPVLHSSGAWIASTAAAGYLGGTLSTTWVGAFVLGNAGFLSSIGLISAGSILTAAGGGVAAVFGATGALAGSALTAVGLGSVAQSLGLIPATILGLTPVGWTIATATVAGAATLGYFANRHVMERINKERVAGGLPEITVSELIKQIKELERQSMLEILIKISKERLDFKVLRSDFKVIIGGNTYEIGNLKYEVTKDGEEFIGLKRPFRKLTNVFTVKAATA